ncbi:hypothetical protein [uncultured Tateyamaria sp.]|uniref:hypothetical protein n=1 Tax=uncultured Tateyamaria sp. TaxID=455651 RepID=UPI0026227332|nr:hypothetical protein [uncultured Tateyamaria sp.]
MLHTPVLDPFSLACVLVLFVLSIVMFRHQFSASRHALALAGLCGVIVAMWIAVETLGLLAQASNSITDLLAAANRPLSVVSEFTVPALIFLCLSGWHRVMHRWQNQPLRPFTYAMHWIIVIGWLAVSLLRPTSLFALTPKLSDMSDAERVAFFEQNSAAVRFHEHAVLGYIALVIAIFALPLVLRLYRKA